MIALLAFIIGDTTEMPTDPEIPPTDAYYLS
jgi:hypothetical protein